MPKVLLITIVIGAPYLERYKAFFYENHRIFASKCNYDFIVVTDFLDPKYKHSSLISLQKSLVCSQSFSNQYDQIIYIDADILFNNEIATPLHLEVVDEKKVLIANEYSQPSISERLKIQKSNGWEPDASSYYKLAGLSLETDIVLNTGVMIFNPKIHHKILEDAYTFGVQSGLNHPRGFHYEQAIIGYTLQKNNCFEILQNHWNAIWLLQKISTNNAINLLEFYRSNKAVHFAGNCDVHLIPELLYAHSNEV